MRNLMNMVLLNEFGTSKFKKGGANRILPKIILQFDGFTMGGRWMTSFMHDS